MIKSNSMAYKKEYSKVGKKYTTEKKPAYKPKRGDITLHIGNIFKEGELEVNSVRKESLLTAADGKKYRTKFYNLDVMSMPGDRPVI